MNTLFVDDNASARKLLSAQLASLGCEDAISCATGAEAVAAVEREQGGIGLVICDLQMPGMDGVEVLRHLARLGFRGRIAVVSSEDERMLHSALRLARAHGLNVVAALQKPISVDELLGVLTQRCQSNAPGRLPVPNRRDPAALAEGIRTGEIMNVYQPKVDLRTGRVTGVEALARWLHPAHGLLYPEEFVATAEEHGLIDALTRVVLRGALEHARRWRAAGLDLDVSVNVSMDNLTDLGFPEVVEQEARRCGVPLETITLEVTESRLMGDQRAPLEILTRLKLKRVRLSIDDFGTGHSSLAQLRDVPFDELKIDSGFVHGANHDPKLRAIFEGSCQMARNLRMKVVAQGVAQQGDWDLLARNGCDYAQGPFVAAPMPGGDVSGWIAEWQPAV